MSDYSSPPGDALIFDAISLPYAAPPGDNLRFAPWSQWLDVGATLALDLHFAGAARLAAEVSAQVALDLDWHAAADLILPVAGHLDLSLSTSAQAGFVLPVGGVFALDAQLSAALAESWYIPEPLVGGAGGVALNWSPQDRIDPRTRSGWDLAPRTEASQSLPWDALRDADATLGGPWRHLPRLERAAANPWRDFARQPQAAPRMRYQAPAWKDRSGTCPWGDLITPRDADWLAAYAYPPPRDADWGIPWSDLRDLAASLELVYSHPAPKDREIPIISGPYWWPRWCIWQYRAPRGDQLIFRFLSAPLYAAPPGNTLIFSAGQETGRERICFDGTWSGPKDAYWYRPRPWPIVRPDIRSYYIIMNTVSLVRVADNLPIPITAMEIGTDHDSWCWTLRANLRRSVDLDMVRPSAGAPVVVEAQINGYAWRFVVEDYGDERRFGQRAYSIGGRSLSAALAAPYSRPRSLLQPAQRSAAQLVDEALDGTGFTADWQLDDWLVPGGAYSATQQTPMQEIITIAAAAGGVVHSAMAAPTVSVVPWYPALPWQWGAVTVDAILPTWQERRTSYQPQPQYSGVYVSGQNQGVSCFVRRAGTNGAEQPQMQTHPLITATEAGLALGKKILADSGRRSLESITAPLLANPGLLTPGKIIEVVDPDGNWRGLVVRCRLAAQRPTVTQQIDVLRYMGT